MENKYIRTKFDGLTEEVYKWEQLSWSPFYKEEFRKKESEKELALSYMHAAEELFKIMCAENNPAFHIKVFRNYQLCIPMLFLCRHTLELTIKLVIESKTKEVEKGHKLQNLWNRLKKIIQIKNEEYDTLINTFKELDSDGMQLRYSKDLDGKEYKPTPCFARADFIIKDTKKLHEYLLSLL